MAYTARKVAAMAAHIRDCGTCSGGDADIIADTYDESLPPDELEGYIETMHGVDQTGGRA